MASRAQLALTPELVKKFLNIPESTVIKNVSFDHETDRIVFYIDDSELLPDVMEGNTSPLVTMYIKEEENGDITSWYEGYKNNWEHA